jgi:hypothetical protein
VVGSSDGKNVVLDPDDIMARKNGKWTTLNLQRLGGDVAVGGALVHASDRRLKSDIRGIPHGLAEILGLKPVSYQYTSQLGVTSLGFIAQDVREVLPELVVERDDGMLSVDYDGVTPVLVRAVQELAEGNQRLVRDNRVLSGRAIEMERTAAAHEAALQELRGQAQARETEVEALRAEVAALRHDVASLLALER